MPIVSGGGGGGGGIPQGGPLTASLDADSFSITDVELPSPLITGTATAAEIDAANGSDLYLAYFGGGGGFRIANGFSTYRADVYPSSATVRFYFGGNTAPADGDVNTSQFVFWLDNTPAATKLMVKAKDSAGTVVTASVALA